MAWIFFRASEALPWPSLLGCAPSLTARSTSTLGDLAGLRYDARWTTLSAAAIGAPHKRDRWWLLARRRDWWQPALAHPHRESIRELAEREQLQPSECGNAVTTNAAQLVGDAVANTNGGGLALHSEAHHHGGGEPRRHDNDGRFALPPWERESAPFPAVRGVDDGISRRVDRLRALGNAVVPACAREAFRLLAGLPAVV
jgi:DNA (cytosine-5)-methyltransferase 1